MSTKQITILVIVLLVILGLYLYFKKKPSSITNTSTTTSQPKTVQIPSTTPAANPTGSQSMVFPLHQGSNGFEVQELQTYLNSQGQNLTVDGSFGPATLAALQAVMGMSTVDQSTFNGIVLGNAQGTSGSVNYDSNGNPIASSSAYSIIDSILSIFA